MTKVHEALIRDMLFADDAVVATHTQHELQTLMDYFSQVCRDFGLTIRLNKTNVLGQATQKPPAIAISPELRHVSGLNVMFWTFLSN